MNSMEFQAIHAYSRNLPVKLRKELKECEMQRLAYDGVDPLDTMIYLQTLDLLQY